MQKRFNHADSLEPIVRPPLAPHKTPQAPGIVELPDWNGGPLIGRLEWSRRPKSGYFTEVRADTRRARSVDLLYLSAGA